MAIPGMNNRHLALIFSMARASLSKFLVCEYPTKRYIDSLDHLVA